MGDIQHRVKSKRALQMAVQFDRVWENVAGPFAEVREVQKSPPGKVINTQAAAGYYLRNLRGGRELYAIGSDPDAAKLYGLQ